MTNKGKISRQIVVASAAFFLAVLTALAPTLSHAVADGTIAGTGKGNLAVGTSSKVGNANDAVYATAVGFEAQATENYSTALGVLVLAQATKTGSLALGSAQNVSTRTGTVTLTTTASGINSIALGTNAKATGDSTTAIGYNAQVSATQSVAIGHNAPAHSLLTDLLQRMAALERKQKLGPLTREDAKLKPSTSLSPAPTQSR